MGITNNVEYIFGCRNLYLYYSSAGKWDGAFVVCKSKNDQDIIAFENNADFIVGHPKTYDEAIAFVFGKI